MRDTGDRPPDPGDGAHAGTKVLFGKYEVGRLLGCGAFAKVYHARHIPSGQSVALKVLSTARLLHAGLGPAVLREVAAMRRLRHPHVLRLHEVLATRSRVYLVLELARGGELFDRLARSGRLSEPAARTLFRQLLSALAFCHARGVFHRDLKPENLLLDEAGRLKVSDFGLAALAPATAPLLRTLCGTPAYVAPEILAKKAYDGAKADLWSSGVVLFVLTAGYLPFNDPNLMSLYRKIYRGDFRCPRWTSPELSHLISRLLDTNPETRITVDEITRHPWFRDGLTDADLAAMMRLHEDLEFKEKANAGAEEEEERELNAFDIISFSSGFDLSGLLGAVPARQRFVSRVPAEAAMQCVEELVREEGLAVRRRTGCKGGRGAAVVERPGGEAVAWVEVYRLAGGLAVVEVEMIGAVAAAAADEGDRCWSGEFWMARLGPALNRTTEPVSTRSGSSVERCEPIGEGD